MEERSRGSDLAVKSVPASYGLYRFIKPNKGTGVVSSILGLPLGPEAKRLNFISDNFELETSEVDFSASYFTCLQAKR